MSLIIILLLFQLMISLQIYNVWFTSDPIIGLVEANNLKKIPNHLS